AWLRFEVDGHDRVGPVEECFFERVAPFTVRIHAVAGAPVSGRQRSAIRIETNDPRPEFRSIELPFAAAFKRPRRSTPTPKALKDRPPRRWIRVPAEMLIVVAVFAIVLVIALLIFMRGLG
ncbi:MAG: hypothetical protein QOF63_1303, partial [Thermoanaerobaculia bacterium]|nr:hypothetical protein [Thermoanaerobaculia bacterium]